MRQRTHSKNHGQKKRMVVQCYFCTPFFCFGYLLLSLANYGQAEATRPLDLPSASHEAESAGIPGYS